MWSRGIRAGPLFDAEGEVVGIDTAASTGREIDGYAIPIQRALAVVAQIRSGTETTAVQIGPAAFLGIEIGREPAMSRYGYASAAAPTSGALVGGVVADSAAANAEIQAGDVITAIDGRAISSAQDLSAALASANPADRVTISWTAQTGQQHSAAVTLGASPVA